MPIADRFRHELVIHRHTPGNDTDGRGDRIDSWEPQAAIPGLITPWRPSREFRTGEPASVGFVDSLGFVAIGTVIGIDDYIQKGSELYHVVGPAQDAGGRGRHLEVDLVQVVI